MRKTRLKFFSVSVVLMLVFWFFTIGYCRQIRERIRERIQERHQENASRITFIYDGLERSYFLFLPENYHDEREIPVLIVLHGGGGNAEGQIRIVAPMNTYADEKGILVVYPNGTGPFSNRFLTWNAGTCCGSAMENHTDDVGFIHALVNKLESSTESINGGYSLPVFLTAL